MGALRALLAALLLVAPLQAIAEKTLTTDQARIRDGANGLEFDTDGDGVAELIVRDDNTLSTGGSLVPTTRAGAATVAVGELAQVNTSGGAFALTLPASPGDGSTACFVDQTGTWDTNNLTVNRGGADTIEGGTSLALSNEYGKACLFYDSETTRWIAGIEGSPGGGGSSLLDAGSGPIVRSVSAATCPSGWYEDTDRDSAKDAGERCIGPSRWVFASDYASLEAAVDACGNAAAFDGRCEVWLPLLTPYDFSDTVFGSLTTSADMRSAVTIRGHGSGQIAVSGSVAPKCGSTLNYVGAGGANSIGLDLQGTRNWTISGLCIDGNGTLETAIRLSADNATSSLSQGNTIRDVGMSDFTGTGVLLTGIGADTNDQVDHTTIENLRIFTGGVAATPDYCVRAVGGTNIALNTVRNLYCPATDVDGVLVASAGLTIEDSFFGDNTGASARVTGDPRAFHFLRNQIENDTGRAIISEYGTGAGAPVASIIGNVIGLSADSVDYLDWNHKGTLVLQGNIVVSRGGTATTRGWRVTPGSNYLHLTESGNDLSVGPPTIERGNTQIRGNVPIFASAAPVQNGSMEYDTTSGDLEYGDNGATRVVVNTAEAQTLSGKTLDGSSNDLAIRRSATDCTALTDGVNGEPCYEQDDDALYVCDPTSGPCDTGAEWRSVGGVGGVDAAAIHDNVAAEISAISAKAAPIAADFLVIEDSAASNAKKSITVGSLEAAIEAFSDLPDLQGVLSLSKGGLGGDASAFGNSALCLLSGVLADCDTFAELMTAFGITGAALDASGNASFASLNIGSGAATIDANGLLSLAATGGVSVAAGTDPQCAELKEASGSGGQLLKDCLATGDTLGASPITRTRAASGRMGVDYLHAGSGAILLGRDNGAGAGVVQELGVGTGIEFNSATIRRAAITGDVSVPAGSNTAQLSTAMRTRSCLIPVLADSSGGVAHADLWARCGVRTASTLTKVQCSTGQANGFSILLYERAETAPTTGTTDLLGAALACDSDGAEDTAFSDSAIAAGSHLVMDISTESLAAGEGGWVQLEWTVN